MTDPAAPAAPAPLFSDGLLRWSPREGGPVVAAHAAFLRLALHYAPIELPDTAPLRGRADGRVFGKWALFLAGDEWGGLGGWTYVGEIHRVERRGAGFAASGGLFGRLDFILGKLAATSGGALRLEPGPIVAEADGRSTFTLFRLRLVVG